MSRRAFLRQQAAATLASDFLTVETAFLQRVYVNRDIDNGAVQG